MNTAIQAESPQGWEMAREQGRFPMNHLATVRLNRKPDRVEARLWELQVMAAVEITMQAGVAPPDQCGREAQGRARHGNGK